MKKIIFLLLLLLENLLFSEYVKEGTYNGANDKKINIEHYDYDGGEKGYFITAMNGYVHTSTFKIDRYLDIAENEIIDFPLDTHYKDYEGDDGYNCTLKIAFLQNGKLVVDSSDDCGRYDRTFKGEYSYSEKDSFVPEKYIGKWEIEGGCAFITKNTFAYDDRHPNVIVGVKEEDNGSLLLDGVTIDEGRGNRTQTRFKFFPNGNVSIDAYMGNTNDKLYNNYNNLRKLKGKELSKCD